MRMRAVAISVVLLAVVVPDMSVSQDYRYGILGQRAPSWGVKEWFNLDGGAEGIDVGDFAGRVIYLFAFQSWCPGCHSHGFPAMKAVGEHYAGNDDVAFVAVQTVFEGFHTNTAGKAVAAVEEFGLDIPVGHDPGADGSRSEVMRRYRTAGTPWTVIIDRDGIVQFNGFSIPPERAIALIDKLLDQPAPRGA